MNKLLEAKSTATDPRFSNVEAIRFLSPATLTMRVPRLRSVDVAAEE
jgi:hypothetical protein